MAGASRAPAIILVEDDDDNEEEIKDFDLDEGEILEHRK